MKLCNIQYYGLNVIFNIWKNLKENTHLLVIKLHRLAYLALDEIISPLCDQHIYLKLQLVVYYMFV